MYSGNAQIKATSTQHKKGKSSSNGSKQRPGFFKRLTCNDNEINNNNIWFGANGNCVPRIKSFLTNSKKGVTPETIWLGKDVGTNKTAKKSPQTSPSSSLRNPKRKDQVWELGLKKVIKTLSAKQKSALKFFALSLVFT